MKDSNAKDKPEVTTSQSASSPPAINIDYEMYQHHLDDSDLTETEKQEFLETLWSIIINFVDLGFEIHPVQQACEQKLDLTQLEPSDVLDSKDRLPHKDFSKAAHSPKKDCTERSPS